MQAAAFLAFLFIHISHPVVVVFVFTVLAWRLGFCCLSILLIRVYIYLPTLLGIFFLLVFRCVWAKEMEWATYLLVGVLLLFRFNLEPMDYYSREACCVLAL